MILTLLFSSLIFAGTDLCRDYEHNPSYRASLALVAKNLRYGYEEMCNLPRLAAIHVTERNFLNPENRIEAHDWVTLHYEEYSCQYFVRKSDRLVTAKNCYNTI